jgi:hypothetical protein
VSAHLRMRSRVERYVGTDGDQAPSTVHTQGDSAFTPLESAAIRPALWVFDLLGGP